MKYHDVQYALKHKAQGKSIDEARAILRDELTQMDFPQLAPGFVDAYLDVLIEKRRPGLTVRKVAYIIWHAPRFPRKRRMPLGRLRSSRDLRTGTRTTSDGQTHRGAASSQTLFRLEWSLPLVASIAFPVLILTVAGATAYFATRVHGAVSDGSFAFSAVLGLLGLGMVAWSLTMLYVFPRMLQSILRAAEDRKTTENSEQPRHNQT